MVLTITPAPTANITNDSIDVICSGDTYIVHGDPTNDSITLWTTSGTGTFNWPGNLHTTYTPSAADISAGSVILTFTVDGYNPCHSVYDQMILNITPAPIADAGAAADVCEGDTYTVNGTTASNYSSLNWTSSGTGTFTAGTTLTPTYDPSAADEVAGSVILTLTAVGNTPCADATSTMVLTIVPAPTADAGPNDNVCEGDTYILGGTTASNHAGITWTSSGTGTFTAGTTLTPTYDPSAADEVAGSVILTLTAVGNTPCADATSTMVLTIVCPPIADAGPNDNVCEGDTYTLNGTTASNYSSLNWTSSGTGTFTAGTTLTPTYDPSAADISAGSVILTLTAVGNTP